MNFSGIESGPLRIRPLREVPADIADLARWLSDPRVLEFYEGRDNPHDEALVREVFFEELKDGETRCIMEFEGKALGYIQFYRVWPDELDEFGFAPDLTVYGIDLFIGEPDSWGRGIGTRMVRLLLEYLFRFAGAAAAILDPVVTNARGIRSYEKSGFRMVRLMPRHELHEGVWLDAWLMAVTPDTVQPPAWPEPLTLLP